jgi:hypothetical protein
MNSNVQRTFLKLKLTVMVAVTLVGCLIEGSDICGCFYCCCTFRPSEIKDWVDENAEGIGQCALCPHYGIDSVIGSRSGFLIDEAFLNEMKGYWF